MRQHVGCAICIVCFYDSPMVSRARESSTSLGEGAFEQVEVQSVDHRINVEDVVVAGLAVGPPY